MADKLVLAALILFNLGASAVLTGVYPGGATGYLVYPNGSVAGFTVGPGGARIYPGVAVLDACSGSILLVEPGGLLVYVARGSAYTLGLMQRMLPPYSLASNCYADVGSLLARPDGEAIEAPPGYTVADALGGTVLLDGPRGMILVEGNGSALLYPGVHPVAYCSDGGILVAVNGSLGVLDVRNSRVTLYIVRGLSYEAGGTQDWSTGACNGEVIAYTSVYNSSKAIVAVGRRGGWCKIYYTVPPAEAAGVAANASTLTIAFEAPGETRLREAPCTVEVRDISVKPERVEVKLSEKRLERIEAPQAVSIPPAGYRLSPYADNILVAVYELGGAAPAPRPTAPLAPLAAVIAVAAAAALLAHRHRRVLHRRGSAESAPQHRV